MERYFERTNTTDNHGCQLILLHAAGQTEELWDGAALEDEDLEIMLDEIESGTFAESFGEPMPADDEPIRRETPRTENHMETKTVSKADIFAHLTALRRIEAREHRRAEAECNGVQYWSQNGKEYDLWTDESTEQLDAIAARDVARILGYIPAGFFVNGDPRGYALKVEAEYRGDLPQDFGGYGILAPSRNLATDYGVNA